MYDGGACHFLLIIYTLFDQRSENRNRILARVPIQLLRISLHALHCDEQLKKYKNVKSILFGIGRSPKDNLYLLRKNRQVL